MTEGGRSRSVAAKRHDESVRFDDVDAPASGGALAPLEANAVGTPPAFPWVRVLDPNAVNSLAWFYDDEEDAVRWSSSVEVFFGFPENAVGFAVGGPSEARPVASLGDALVEPVLASVRAGAVSDDYDLRVIVTDPDGVPHEVIVRASVVDVEGGPTQAGLATSGRAGYIGVVVDISRQNEVNRAFGDIADRFQLLTDLSPDVIVVHQDGVLVYGNPAAVRAVGAETMEQCYGWPISAFLHPDDMGGAAERISQLREHGQVAVHGEVRVIGLDGRTAYMDVRSVLTTWNGRPAHQVIMRDLSERRAAEAAARYRASLVAHVSDAIIGIDSDGHIDSWNEAAETIYGWSEEEVVGRSLVSIVSGSESDSASVIERGERVHVRRDGARIEVRVSLDPLLDSAGQPTGWVVVCTELTDARRAEAGRRAAEERYSAVVSSLSEGIVVFDADGTVCASNDAAARILGDRLSTNHGHTVFAGKSMAIRGDGLPLPGPAFPHELALATGQPQDEVVVGVIGDGGRRQWLLMSARVLSPEEGCDQSMVVCSFTDITERKAAEAQLHWLAYHDQLTGLTNRAFALTQLGQTLLTSRRHGVGAAVMSLDLDRFKMVNDSLGHAIGDEVLVGLANRLKAAVRGGDIVSRLAADEFMVVCRNVVDGEMAVALAQELCRVLAEPVTVSLGREIALTASAGVVFVGDADDGSPEDLLQRADLAMFDAKERGRNRVAVFDAAVHHPQVARLELYEDLRRAIECDELSVHYQPIAAVDDDRIVGMEALVRWFHPARGLLPPSEFVPYAEETDLINLLGRWVLRKACTTMAQWRRELPGAGDAYMTVNLSAQQLNDPDLLGTIAAVLDETGLPPEALVMEVTESMLMSDTSAGIAVLGGIHEMGVGLAIDDFGTGYSSLAQIKRFPVKILKIDHSFVDGLGNFEHDEAIVAAIVQMSKALGLTVLAEGVETTRQLERVTALGCDLYQGYLLARPTLADQAQLRFAG